MCKTTECRTVRMLGSNGLLALRAIQDLKSDTDLSSQGFGVPAESTFAEQIWRSEPAGLKAGSHRSWRPEAAARMNSPLHSEVLKMEAGMNPLPQQLVSPGAELKWAPCHPRILRSRRPASPSLPVDESWQQELGGEPGSDVCVSSCSGEFLDTSAHV